MNHTPSPPNYTILCTCCCFLFFLSYNNFNRLVKINLPICIILRDYYLLIQFSNFNPPYIMYNKIGRMIHFVISIIFYFFFLPFILSFLSFFSFFSFFLSFFLLFLLFVSFFLSFTFQCLFDDDVPYNPFWFLMTYKKKIKKISELSIFILYTSSSFFLSFFLLPSSHHSTHHHIS